MSKGKDLKKKSGPRDGQRPDLQALPRRVAAALHSYNMLPLPSPLGVAVSGGADSVALLRLLLALGHQELCVLHVQHGLRGEASAGDEAFVANLAATWGLPFLRADRPAPAKGNLEQALRRGRQEAFAAWMASGQVQAVATGHTQSDQAETVLLRLLRGTGGTGLAGVLPKTEEGLLRPLLTCSRQELRDWLRALGQPWREDASNAEPRFLRNRVRAELLPLLASYNPKVEMALARMATLAASEEEYWRQECDRRLEKAAELAQSAANSEAGLAQGAANSEAGLAQGAANNDAELAQRPANGKAALAGWQGRQVIRFGRGLPMAMVADAQPALARRLIRRWLQREVGHLRRLESQHVEAVLEMARTWVGNNTSANNASSNHGAPGSNRMTRTAVTLPGVVVSCQLSTLYCQVAEEEPRQVLELSGSTGDRADRPNGQGNWGRYTCQWKWGEGGFRSGGWVSDEREAKENGKSGYTDGERIEIVFSDSPKPLQMRGWRRGDWFWRTGRPGPEPLKILLRQLGVTSWELPYWPIVSEGESPIWVKGLGVDQRYAAIQLPKHRLQILVTNASDKA